MKNNQGSEQSLIVTMEGNNAHLVSTPIFILKNKNISFENNDNVSKILGSVFAFYSKYGGDKMPSILPKKLLDNCKIAKDFCNQYGTDVTANEILFAAYLIAGMEIRECKGKDCNGVIFTYRGIDYAWKKSFDIAKVLKSYYMLFGSIKPKDTQENIKALDLSFEHQTEALKCVELYYALFGNLSIAQILKFKDFRLK